MLYLVLGCGIFLLAVVPYIAVKLKSAGQPVLTNKGLESIAVLAVVLITVAIVGITLTKDYKTEQAKKEAETKVLTLNRFIQSYTESAEAIKARHDFDWTVGDGDEADKVKIAVNKHCTFTLSLKKTPNKEVTGMTIVIGGDTDNKEAAEMLFVLYALVKTFNPEDDYKVIADFIAELIDAESGHEVQKGTVKYSQHRLGGNMLIFITCE